MRKDPHIANIFSAEEEDCLSLEQMTAYQEGKLAGQDKHLVERHLLNCELCAITLESIAENGVETIATGAAEIADTAWDRVQQRQNRKRRGAFFWIASAAAIALLVTVGYFTMSGPSEEKIGNAFAEAMEGTPPLETPSTVTDGELAMEDQRKENADAAIERAPSKTVDGLAKEDLEPTAKMAPTPMPTPMPTQTPSPLTGKDEIKSVSPSGKSDIKGGTGLPTKDAMGGATGKSAMKDKVSAGKDAVKSENGTYYSGTSGTVSPTLTSPTPKASPSAKPATNNDFAFDNMARYETEDDAMDEESVAGAEDKVVKKTDAKNIDIVEVTSASRNLESRKELAGPEKQEGKSRNRDLQNAPQSKSKAGTTPTRASAEMAGDANVPTAPGTGATVTERNYEQGIIAYKEGNYREAAQELRKAAELTPSNLDAHIFAADAFLRISQPHAALFHIERVLAVPGNSHIDDAEWYKALAYLQLKEGKKAKAQLEKVAASSSKFKAQAEKALSELK